MLQPKIINKYIVDFSDYSWYIIIIITGEGKPGLLSKHLNDYDQLMYIRLGQ